MTPFSLHTFYTRLIVISTLKREGSFVNMGTNYWLQLTFFFLFLSRSLSLPLHKQFSLLSPGQPPRPPEINHRRHIRHPLQLPVQTVHSLPSLRSPISYGLKVLLQEE
jgi:hypothetical protein